MKGKNVIELMQWFANPGRFEESFLNFLREAELPFDNSKQIAAIAYFHRVTIGGSTEGEFFKGTFNDATCNLPGGSFTLPDSAHAVIFGARYAEVVDAGGAAAADYVPGATTGATKSGRMTIRNNNQTVLKEYPITESLEGLTTSDDGYIEFNEPIIWAGQTNLSAEIDFETAPAADTQAQLTLLGIGLI